MSSKNRYENTKQDQEALVVQHAQLVKRIAYHLLSRLPSSVMEDDLVQSGMIGLLEAARKYDPSQGASFETYAGIRIRGSMLDEIRKGDWTPRSVHRKSREVAAAIRELEAENSREATAPEVAEKLNISIEEYNSILNDSSGAQVFSVDQMEVPPDVIDEDADGLATTPDNLLQKDDIRTSLAKAIATLPERERLVISLYYKDELNLKEIGQVLDVSESRVSQIRSQAYLRLRARMQED